MKKHFGRPLIGISFTIFAACGSQQNMVGEETNIGYKIARHYYLNSDADLPTNPIVTSPREFRKRYGSAAVMTKNGEPTPIDFHRQFVISITLPQTNYDTEILPTKLTSDGKTLTVHYKIRTKEYNTLFTMRPICLIIVDKKYMTKTCTLLQE